MHMQQQIGSHNLFKRTFKGLDQFGWQLTDESDGISDHCPASRGKAQAAHGWIKRREQQATAKIQAAEAAMVTELREKAATLAIASAAQIITSKLDDDAAMALIDQSAAEIEKLN